MLELYRPPYIPHSPIKEAYAPLERETPKERLARYTGDTWNSLVSMVNPETGLINDKITFSPTGNYANTRTSPSNIGLWLSSTVAAYESGIIPQSESKSLLTKTLSTLSSMNRIDGLFLNWYDTNTDRDHV